MPLANIGFGQRFFFLILEVLIGILKKSFHYIGKHNTAQHNIYVLLFDCFYEGSFMKATIYEILLILYRIKK